MNDTLTQARYRVLKSNLTRAVNSKDPDRIIRTCNTALDEFGRNGWPDDWTRWQRAGEDARLVKRLAGHKLGHL